MKTVSEIQSALRKKASAKYRKGMSSFAIDSSKAYGTPTPEIRKVASQVKKAYKGEPKKLFRLLMQLWKTGNYESRKVVAILLPHCEEKDVLKVLTKLLSQSGDWSICDGLSADTIRPIMKKNPRAIEKLFRQWSKSSNLWVRRAVAASIASYSISSDGRKYRPLLHELKNDKEYYVRKAAQWAEREMAK